MKTIRLLFEYHTGNVFIYGDDGFLISPDLPDEVKGDQEIESLYRDIWEKFDRSCEDEDGEFVHSGIGHPFRSTVEEMDFVREVCYFVKLLKDRLGGKYKFVDEYWEDLAWDYWPEE